MTKLAYPEQLRRALNALYLDAERIAVRSYATYIRHGRCEFNDRIWRSVDPAGFRIARRARELLQLHPIEWTGERLPREDLR